MSGASTAIPATPAGLGTRESRSPLAPRFDARRCKQCGLCAHMCPTGALRPPVRVSTTPTLPELEVCTGCRTCEYICPDFAVKMTVCPPAAGDPRSTAGGTHSPNSEAGA
ncbi:MAG: 4Fe-4S binding protein [Thermoleophilia bacterium]